MGRDPDRRIAPQKPQFSDQIVKKVLPPLANCFRRLLRDDEGVTLVEYGLLITLIALVCIAAASTLGINICALGYNVANSL